MRVAVVGAGALGIAYAARLALRAGCEVSLVARAPRPATTVHVERVETGEVVAWTAPPCAVRAAAGVDVVLLAVRYEQLGEAAASVGAGSAPVIVLTPMMPVDEERLAAALPGRIVAAMPSVVAYAKSPEAIRYWLPRPATTWIDDRRAGSGTTGAEVELARLLNVAGVPAKIDRDVLARNVATTITFYPLVLGLDTGDGIDGLLGDPPLLELTLRAADDARALAATVGRPDPWVAALMRFVRPWTLKAGVALARSRSPEAVAYVEEHFGRKLRAQNAAMGVAVMDLARQKGTPHASLARLAARLGGR